MIRINLLPHREEKRKKRKAAFIAMLLMGAALGALIVVAVGVYNQTRISIQEERNRIIKEENARLDEQIKEIASLRGEIDALKARQQAVEDLQSDRNQPVYLMDELVQQVPEGIYLRSFKQAGQRVVLSGYAQSNERVSDLLRNLNGRSQWLEKPDLVEIRAAGIGTGRDAKKVFDFIVNVGIKRQRDMEPGAPGASASAAGLPGAAKPAAPGLPAAPAAPAAPGSPVAPAAPAAPAPKKP